jgi:hypothetical protein
MTSWGCLISMMLGLEEWKEKHVRLEYGFRYVNFLWFVRWLREGRGEARGELRRAETRGGEARRGKARRGGRAGGVT